MRKTYFTVMEDYEIYRIFPNTKDGIPHLDIESYELNLIKKLELLNGLSKDFGVKWNHFLDIGNVFLIPKLGNRFDKEWGVMQRKLFRALKKTVRLGHELHMHYHGANDALEKEFAFKYDSKVSGFVPVKNLREIASKRMGFTSYFPGKGDGFFEKKLVQFSGMIKKEFGVKYPIFFRPGTWDAGSDLGVYYKILSRAGVGSSSLDGYTFGHKTKGANPGNEIFYVKSGSGKIMEFLPTKLPFATSYMAPIYPESYLRLAFMSLKRSRHPIKALIEMYHINDVNEAHLKKIEAHFRYAERKNAEFVTLSRLADMAKKSKIPEYTLSELERKSEDIFGIKFRKFHRVASPITRVLRGA